MKCRTPQVATVLRSADMYTVCQARPPPCEECLGRTSSTPLATWRPLRAEHRQICYRSWCVASSSRICSRCEFQVMDAVVQFPQFGLLHTPCTAAKPLLPQASTLGANSHLCLAGAQHRIRQQTSPLSTVRKGAVHQLATELSFSALFR